MVMQRSLLLETTRTVDRHTQALMPYETVCRVGSLHHSPVRPRPLVSNLGFLRILSLSLSSLLAFVQYKPP